MYVVTYREYANLAFRMTNNTHIVSLESANKAYPNMQENMWYGSPSRNSKNKLRTYFIFVDLGNGIFLLKV
jgi:hypothetical protein